MSEYPRPIDDAAQPALQKLEQDQSEVVKGLREGFDGEWELVWWLHDLSAATLGEADDDLFGRFFRDETFKESVLNSSERDQDLSEPAQNRARQGVEEHILLPPFNSAYRKLSGKASEYLSGDRRPSVHPDAPVALLPAVGELTRRQRHGLEALRDGFDSYDELLDWRRDLIGASYGQISDGTLQDLGRKDGHAVEVLTDGALTDGEPPNHLEDSRRRLSVYILLPVFNAGIRTMVSGAGEDLDATEGERPRDTLDV